MSGICHLVTWLRNDPAWASAIAAYAGVFIAWWGFWKQGKNYKESLALDLAMKLDDRFIGEEFQKLRSAAARALLDQKNRDGLADAEDVFDFFETIGLFVKRKSLDAELVYSFFFHWVNLYWNAGNEYIKQRQEHSVTLWLDFEKLYKKLIAIEQQRDKHSKDIHPSREQIEKQLREEIE